MLAPIITKDMKLFPTRPLPAGIKNVRSRAQSLDQFNQVQNSGSARGRIVPVKPRSSQSTGNLPAAAAAAASSGNGGAAPTTSPATTNSVPSFSRSPPKTTIHRKTTLTAIQEGVEMGHSHLHRQIYIIHQGSGTDSTVTGRHQECAQSCTKPGPIQSATTNSVPSFSRSPPKTTIHRKTTLTAIQEGVEMGHSHLHRHHHPVRHTESQPESKRSTDVPRRNSKKSRKTDDENNVTRNGHCENMGSTGTVGSDPPTEKKEKKGVLKWLTSALRKSKDKDMTDSCSCNSS
ncbi:hypothetical protein Q1695_001458 [Nippostrongylus brasiliensis]|nr:hypothetical protein Q1695_001458 [Nippostrongylus brasiliensis]